MMNYTKDDLERAQAYLRERLEAEGLVETAISTILEECAETLVDFFLGGATQEEIDMAIESLVDSLLEWIDDIAVSDHDRTYPLLYWLHAEWNDGVLEEVLKKRAGTFHDEVAVVCAVGELLHRSKGDILASIKSSMRDPWHNPLLEEVREEVKDGSLVLPDGLDIDERHYGSGVPVSSLTGLQMVGKSAVAATWVQCQYMDEKDKGAVGYFVLRGSSYDCDLCDDNVAHGFFSIDEEPPVPTHSHCCCYLIYTDVERI